MDPLRRRRIEELFHEALERAGPARAAFLDDACSEPDVRRQVHLLLEQSGDGLLDRPAAVLLAGARLGPYQIQAVIGSGGMGTVYRAIDTRLNRSVAIKISAAQFTARFEREARAIAALNHPHVCTMYDVGPDYLVMEYLEGETLAARLARGRLPVEQAIRSAIQIAGALAEAHRRQILHRDLKPANIMLTKSGAKLLDFGLAKMAAGEGVSATGAVLGTIQYMAPEQLGGKEADARSDIYSFGAVLYEMLTGRKVCEKSSPPPREMLSLALARLVEACLAEDPDARRQSIADVAQDLQWLGEPQEDLPRGRSPWLLAAVAAAVLAIGALVVVVRTPRNVPAPIHRTFPLEGSAEGGGAMTSVPLALSPDGRWLAFILINVKEARTQLWLRNLESETSTPVAGAQFVQFPFWSPDSQELGFFQGSGREWSLKAIPVVGGAARTICHVPGRGDGATWNREGTILFAAGGSPVFRVPFTGGDPQPLTQLDQKAGETSHSMPEFLPDGRHFLYWTNNRDESKTAIWVGSLDSRDRTLVMLSQNMHRFAPPDLLLFVRDGKLLAQHLNLKQFRLTGVPVVVAADISQLRPPVSGSETGVLAYYRSHFYQRPLRQLAWYSRDGKRLESVGQPHAYSDIALSRDNKLLAAVIEEETKSPGVAPSRLLRARNIYLHHFETGVLSQLTSDQNQDDDPTWTPDSRRLLYVNHLDTTPAPPDRIMEWTIGDPAPLQVWQVNEFLGLDSLSADGRFLLFRRNRHTAALLPLASERKPGMFFDSPVALEEMHPSPDGRWIAYETNVGLEWRVYVAAFPSMKGIRQVSADTGCIPLWRQDGRELFYSTPQGQLMSIEVGAGTALEVSAPKPLFSMQVRLGCYNDQYAVSADGRRFLVIEPPPTPPDEIHVVMNWASLLSR